MHFITSWVDPRDKFFLEISNVSTFSIGRVIVYKFQVTYPRTACFTIQSPNIDETKLMKVQEVKFNFLAKPLYDFLPQFS